MSNYDAQIQEIEAKMNGNSNGSGKGFTTNTANKAKRDDRTTIKLPATPDAEQLKQVTQSGLTQVRETALSTAGQGATALNALATQREQVKTQLKEEIKRLTDPNLFFAELMDEVAAELNHTPVQFDFFGCYSSEELVLPETRQFLSLPPGSPSDNCTNSQQGADCPTTKK